MTRTASRVQGVVLARAVSFLFLIAAAGCKAQESHRTVETDKVATYQTPYNGPRYALAIGKFANASMYMRGIFAEGGDRLGTQAKTILKTHLSQSGRFSLVDRDNMDEIAKESQISGVTQNLAGAEVMITGEVTQFGRKTTGDKQLFGIGGRGETQQAYSVVSLNVVDVATSRVVYSVEGAGEYELSEREVLGFGSTASYDSTLNGKVLNLAIAKAVDNLVEGVERGGWSPSKKQYAAP